MGRSYKDLVAWQKSMELVTATYRANRWISKRRIIRPHITAASRSGVNSK